VSFETPEAIETVIETPINLACTARFLRGMAKDIINEQCQFCKINGKLYSSFTKDTAFADSGSSYVMDPSMKELQNVTHINELNVLGIGCSSTSAHQNLIAVVVMIIGYSPWMMRQICVQLLHRRKE